MEMREDKSIRKIALAGALAWMLLMVCFVGSKPSFADSSVNEIITKLQSGDWNIRSGGVSKLLHVDIVIGKGMTRGIKPEYKNNEELRVALINCLKKESKAAPVPGEAYAEHVSMLISIVADLDDERALPMFLGEYLGANSDTYRYLARMKDEKVMPRLLSYLAQHKYPGRRSAVLKIIGEKLKLNNIDEEYRHKIKQIVFESVKDKDSGVRIWALRALIYYDYDEIIPIIEEMAKKDDYSIDWKKPSGALNIKYPIREEAEKILKKMKDKK